MDLPIRLAVRKPTMRYDKQRYDQAETRDRKWQIAIGIVDIRKIRFHPAI